MEDLKMDFLPVVNSQGKFVGIAGRTQITANLIIDVVRKLENKK
jgi:hypothetical protein